MKVGGDILCEMFQLYVIFTFLSAVFAYRTQPVAVNEPPEVFNELPCLSYGGICVARDDCPDGAQSELSGLCPVQQRRGVECCHGIPKSEKRCIKNGGECMPQTSRCPEKLIYKEAIDCKPDEICCILVY